MLDTTFEHAHRPLEELERQGTRGMDSTHTSMALNIDPSTIGQRDAVDATSTMRIVVGRCSSVKSHGPGTDEEASLSAGSTNPSLQWVLTVRTGVHSP